jgi:O-acetylserine/cysteine efflux transporter
MSLFTAPQLMAVSAMLEHNQLASLRSANHVAWMAFAYTVLLGAIAGFGLWFWLIAHCSMTLLAPFALLQAVFAVAAGVIFLHEPLTATLVAGTLVCIAGVAVTQSGSLVQRRIPTASCAPFALLPKYPQENPL